MLNSGIQAVQMTPQPLQGCHPAPAKFELLKHAGVSQLGSLACTAGRKAVQVAPQPHHGLVAVLQESFGLVEYTPNQPYVKEAREGMQRIRFNPTDVSCLAHAECRLVCREVGSLLPAGMSCQGLCTLGGICTDFEICLPANTPGVGKLPALPGVPCAAVTTWAETLVPAWLSPCR